MKNKAPDAQMSCGSSKTAQVTPAGSSELERCVGCGLGQNMKVEPLMEQ